MADVFDDFLNDCPTAHPLDSSLKDKSFGGKAWHGITIFGVLAYTELMPTAKTKKNKTTKPAKKMAKKPSPSLTRVQPEKIYQITKKAVPAPSLFEKDSVASDIMRRIRGALAPTQFSLRALTEAHKKHKEAIKNGGGHYAIKVVSEVFTGLSLKQRQQWIFNLVGDLMGKTVHALQMDLKEPSEVPLKEDFSLPFKAPKPKEKQSSKKQRS